ncbi:hypothetical protein Micbo1qcDRAFT_155542 [Microdochium bolleyi]|uniref:Early meiotic induction protein 1 n=1 Tax=Microdochium bolleyi TaxID=196109 RepID=A0A136JI87_9PEZI|nr:hypothetical protein Micbo1qcDRAFT_155542 [Microdochium bolleyi]
MGWLWSSATASTASTSVVQDPTPEATRPAAQSPPASKPDDDFYDPEIAKFVQQFQTEFGGKKSNTAPAQQTPVTQAELPKHDQSSKPPSSSWNLWGSSSSKTADAKPDAQPAPQRQQEQPSPDRLDPISESLLPTTMSCRQAFDTAFHCNSLGGQWTSVYRAGSVRSCSEHWDNFWFCMRTRTYTGEVKEEAIRDYYRQRELGKYYGPDKPNSTDIWEARAEKVEPGTAFRKTYVQPDISDEEWWQMEIEHRRKVQEELQRKDAAAAAGR